MRKFIPIVSVLILFLFAGAATAGQLQLLDHQVDVMHTSEESALYSWEAEINNPTLAPVKADLEIAFHNEAGQVIGTIDETVTIPPEQETARTGSAWVELDAANVKDTSAKLPTRYSIGK